MAIYCIGWTSHNSASHRRNALLQKETQILSTIILLDADAPICGFCGDFAKILNEIQWILCFQMQNDKFHKWDLYRGLSRRENLNKRQNFAKILVVPEFVQNLQLSAKRYSAQLQMKLPTEFYSTCWQIWWDLAAGFGFSKSNSTCHACDANSISKIPLKNPLDE